MSAFVARFLSGGTGVYSSSYPERKSELEMVVWVPRARVAVQSWVHAAPRPALSATANGRIAIVPPRPIFWSSGFATPACTAKVSSEVAM